MWTFGIRGVFGKTLFPEDVLRLANLFSSFCSSSSIALGRDVRISGESLRNAFVSGVLASGKDVVDFGIVPTPVVQFGCRLMKIEGAVITASHNPPEYNGLKFLDKKGVGYLSEEYSRIFNREPVYKGGGSVYHRDILPTYFKKIKTQVDLSSSDFFVVCDTCNSTMSLVVPRLLRDVGCDVLSINSHLDGRFPGRPPEPRPENLKRLSEIVVSCGADFGVAYDSDGDRAIFVDEKGNVIEGDESFALIAQHEVKKNEGGTVVTTVATSEIIDEVVSKEGGKVVRTRVGDPIVTRTLIKLGGILGGEENGGVIYPRFNYGRDGSLTTLKMLEVLSLTNRKLSRLIKALPKYYRFKERIHTEKKEMVMKRILEKVKEHFSVDLTDGVKIFFDDGWLLIRPSGTEPVIRVFSESRKKSKAKKYLEFGKRIISEVTRC